MDANELMKKVTADVVYIDPPYNARQYVNFYHVLENLARWEKPTELEGNSMKFKRNHLKSDYSKSKAPIVFEELINVIDSKLIVVSYNNTYNARSGASNNKISEKQLIDILEAKGKVTRYEIKYKAFNAGKTDFNNHKEYLYICEVNN
jgi:adenine-specific DNA-methyltransferase